MLVVSDHTPAFEGGPFLMLSERSSVEIHALHEQGWTISAIARHTNHDRKTVRAYLNGDRQPGVRVQAPDPFEAFVDYVTARLTEDPHLWAQTLLDELRPLGYEGSYPTLTRQIRTRSLRPACVACAHVTKRPNAVIEHPPGEETQFDWLELPDPPTGWGFPTKKAFLLVGSLAHSGVWRAVISPSMDVPHLLAAMTTLLAALGGLTRVWRFDRMATVLHPVTKDLTPMFAAFAKHHSVQAVVCRPRSGNRRAWSRRTTTPPRNAGGATSPTSSPSSRRKSASTRSRDDRTTGRGKTSTGAPPRRRCSPRSGYARCHRSCSP